MFTGLPLVVKGVTDAIEHLAELTCQEIIIVLLHLLKLAFWFDFFKTSYTVSFSTYKIVPDDSIQLGVDDNTCHTRNVPNSSSKLCAKRICKCVADAIVSTWY